MRPVDSIPCMSQSLTCLLIFTLTCYNYSICQISDQVVNHFTQEEGLPSMTIYDIDQDSKGFIWAATESGISKFDGYKFTTLTAENGLIYNEVVSIFIDSKDRIWLNTSGPVSYVQNDSVYLLEQFEYPNMAWDYQSLEDDEGDIWLSSSKELSILDGETLNPKFIEDSQLRNMKNILVIGKQGDAVYFYKKEHIYKVVAKRIVDKIPIEFPGGEKQIYKLKFALQIPNLFVADGKKLTVIDLETRKSKIIAPIFPLVKHMVVDGKNLIANDTPNGMIKMSLNEKYEIEKRAYLFEEDNICLTFLDKNKYLWVPTFKSGIYVLKPDSEIILDYLGNSEIVNISLQSSFKDPYGVLWLGTQDGRIFRLENDKLSEFKIPFANRFGINRVLDMDFISKNKFIVTTDVGILLFENGAFKQASAVASKQVTIQGDSMLISAYNCTTKAHVDFYNGDVLLSSTNIKSAEGAELIFENRSYANYLSPDGVIWISDEKEGLVKIDKKDTIFYRDISSIFRPTIKKLIPYNDSIIIAATKGEGLIFITPNDYFVLDRKKGLSSNSINDLQIVGEEILVSTNNGLNIIQANNVTSNQYNVKVIDESYGIKSAEIRSANAINDKLFLLTSKGLVTIKKDKLKDLISSNESAFYFKNIRVNGQEYPLENNYELSSEENNLVIEYSGVNFTDMDKLLYAYKMEAVDDDWIYTRSRETHYSNLKPGNYTFSLGIVTDDSRLLDESKKIKFEIKPHFTQSFWFKALIFLIGLIILAVLLYSFNLQRQKTLLSNMVQTKTSELDMRITELANTNYMLEMSNRDLQNFAQVASHDLKSPLRNVTSFIQLLKKKNKNDFDEKDLEYISYATEGVERMESTIDNLLLYSSLDNRQETTEVNIYHLLEEIKLDLGYFEKQKAAKIIIEGNMPMLNVHELKIKQLFQNLIENGLKYNKNANSVVSIYCQTKKDVFQFSVKDNGIGIKKEYQDEIFGIFKRLHNSSEYSGSGIGLAICRRVVESYGGRMWMDSVPGFGSTFYFTIARDLSST